MTAYARSGQFTVGPWTVTPALDRLQRNGKSVTIEPLAMAVLVYLARNANQVIAVEDLTKILWPKRAVGDDAVAAGERAGWTAAQRLVGEEGLEPPAPWL